MDSSEKQRRNAKNSYKQLAENLAGFGDILEKTNTHLEEMDPVDAEVQRREVFKKNLSEYVEKNEEDYDNLDSDDTDSGVVISQTGSWTAENCNERLKMLEQERKARKEEIALYIQSLQNKDCGAEDFKTDKEKNKTNTNEEDIKTELDRDKKNSRDCVDDIPIGVNTETHNILEHLGIPEISFEAPTPTPASPCPPDIKSLEYEEVVDNKTDIAVDNKGEDDVDQKNEDEFDKKNYVAITDEDWDRMEALADQEQEEENEIVENKENRVKWEEFMKNPQVDISKSRLAQELKIIMEETTRRMEEDNFIANGSTNTEKRKKKRANAVKFEEPEKTSFFNDSSAKEVKNYSFIEEAVKKVEIEKHGVRDITDDNIGINDVDDHSLLDGFMDGFEEDNDPEPPVEEENGILKYIEILKKGETKNDKMMEKMKMNILLTTGLIAVLAMMIIWNKVSHQ